MLKIGVVGCGYWGKNHIRVLSSLDGCKLVGISDKDTAKKKVAKEYKTKFYKNYKRLLSNTDAVVIVTPPDTHYQIARDALKKGKHALVEKPFTSKVFQAERLIKLANKQKKILMVGHIFLYNPAFKYIRKILRQKELGEVYYVYSRRVNFGIIRSDVDVIKNFAPHDFSMLVELFGAPISVKAWGKDFIQEGISDIAFLELEFKNNILSHTHLSWLDPLKQRQMIIVGSNKMLFWDDTDQKNPIIIYDKSFTVPEKWKKTATWDTYAAFKAKTRVGETTYPKIPKEEPLNIELKHFIESIEKNKKTLSNGSMGLLITKLIEKSHESLSNSGKPLVI